jgi:hypothetical protein
MGKRGKFHLEERDGDAGGQMKDGAARGGMHEPDQIAPGKAMLDWGEGALPVKGPCLPQGRFEADAVLIHGPQFHRGLRKSCRDLAQERAQMCLEVGLGRGVGLHMTRTGFTPPRPESPQIAPAGLPTQGASQVGAAPGGHGPPAPAVTFGMRVRYRSTECCKLLRCLLTLVLLGAMPPVAYTVGSLAMVAAGHLTNPKGGESGHARNGRSRHATR